MNDNAKWNFEDLVCEVCECYYEYYGEEGI